MNYIVREHARRNRYDIVPPALKLLLGKEEANKMTNRSARIVNVGIVTAFASI